MNKIIKAIAQNELAFPAFLLFICALSYGLLSPLMKFFHDEYSILWFYHRANDVTLFFESNRPFLAHIHEPLLNLFGANSYLWPIFGVVTRWFHALCLLWLVREIWPDDQSLAIIASLLCAVYPAFQAQFASMMFSILFLLFSFFTLKSLKRNKNRTALIITSVLLSCVNLITNECEQ